MARIISLILVLSVIVPLIIGQCNIEKALPFFRRSTYDFSVELIRKITEETDNHFIASPLSVWSLLASVSLAAEGETLSEIKRVLRLHPHKCFNNKYFEIVRRITDKSATRTSILERSSTLFVDEKMAVKESFRDKVKKTRICDIETLPFENFAEVATTINERVNEATHGNVDEIVEASDLHGVYLILVDALYFKGTWAVPFPTAETEVSPFYDEKRNQLGDVNLMFVNNNFNATRIEQIKANVLELPYDSRFAMLIFLPYPDVPVTSVIDSLHLISLSSIYNLFEKQGAQQMYVQIPKFTISSDLNNLKELLTDMGLSSMFDPNLAQFPHISDFALYISELIQKAAIQVTEEGTEASAASVAEFEARSFPDQFIANKPFLFKIIDKYTEVVLFSGVYSKPSVVY